MDKRVVQLLPTISYGDAVSNDALAIQSIIQELGFSTQIYAENVDPRLPKGSAIPFDQFPELSAEDVILYHGSTGTDINDKISDLGGRKVMIYHNITPPSFFHPYSPTAEALTARGLQGMCRLAEKIDYCIADSEFNRRDLLRMGYTCPIEVCPVLIPFSDYEKEPSHKILKQYEEDGVTNLLFVGRIAPNKKQEDVIRAFYFYHKYYNSNSRLFLVGSWNGMESYYNRLVDYAVTLGISEQVIFTGHIRFDEILAYYNLADAFVCMSEHEGFCVPLVEAMYFQVPIVAYAAAAVPDTLGNGGILLETSEPLQVAETINKIITDCSLRTKILAKQVQRLKDFHYGVVSKRFKEVISNIFEYNGEKTPKIIQLSSTISRGDAVSNDILAFQKAFVDMGYPSTIYTEFSPKGNGWDMIQSEKALPSLRKTDMVLYHHATGTDMAGRFSQLLSKKILVYHNVTPPEFFAPYNKQAAESCRLGLKNVQEIRKSVDGCISISKFNQEDLKRMGYECPITVCPILIPFADYRKNPDPQIVKKYSDGRTNIIFVGRVAPNKKFEDVIGAFAKYQQHFDSTARLILVGSYNEHDPYFQFLCDQVKRAEVKNVQFTGHIPFSQILAYYHTADAFLCMSEHEGFCVPLVEAMYFNIPIVAYASSAIPDTLGGSGILIKRKEEAAEALYRVVWDSEARNEILRGQQVRLGDFTYEHTRDVLKRLVRKYMGEENEG